MLELSTVCDPSCEGASPGTTHSPHLCRHVRLPCTTASAIVQVLHLPECSTARCGLQLQECLTEGTAVCLLQEVPW